MVDKMVEVLVQLMIATIIPFTIPAKYGLFVFL